MSRVEILLFLAARPNRICSICNALFNPNTEKYEYLRNTSDDLFCDVKRNVLHNFQDEKPAAPGTAPIFKGSLNRGQ